MNDTEKLEVTINGTKYFPMSDEIKNILIDLDTSLWCEAYYDHTNNSTRNFAKPLADKMKILIKILGLRK